MEGTGLAKGNRPQQNASRAELTERMKKFHLELHPEKTRLLEFGPHAIDQRQWRGERKPLGFSVLQKHTDKEFTMN